MTLIKKLKQRKTALYASLFAVIFVGTPHIVPVVSQFSQFKTAWLSLPHALAYALALEVGIVFFALRSKMTQTIVFAIIATTLYLGYYDSHIPWISIVPIMPLVISISLPIMIVLIAHETGRKRTKRNKSIMERIPEAYKTAFETKEPPILTKKAVSILNHDDGSITPLHDSKPRNPKPLPEEIRQKIIELKKRNAETGKPTFQEIADETNTSKATVHRVNETIETS